MHQDNKPVVSLCNLPAQEATHTCTNTLAVLFSLSIPPANDPLNRELSAEARCRMQSEWEMLRVTAERDSPSSFRSTLQVSRTTAASTKTCWTGAT